MAAFTTDVGTGSTLTFSSGLFAEITNIDLSGMSRGSFDTSHMGSANNARTFIPGKLRDPGELAVEFNFDGDADYWAILNSVAETVTLTLPVQTGNSTGATLAASGFLTNIDLADPLEDVIKGTGTLKLSGDQTQVDGAV